MVTKVLHAENELYIHDFLYIDVKKKYVTFHCKIDNDGQLFKISKDELKEMLK